MRFYYIIILIAVLTSCKEQSKTTTSSKVATEQSTAPVASVDAKRSGLPPLTLDMMKKMIAEVDYIDYIMYDLPFSVSQDTKEDINSNIMFISNIPVGDVSSACKPIGRKFYNIKGETYLTADIYFSNGCAFYIFLEGEQPKYSAKFTKEGYNFYTQIVAQGDKIKASAGGQVK
jgi:hypothetical protein